jgi:8-oxo-dGTP pyrophosphatase MutT (NUDIX family)
VTADDGRVVQRSMTELDTILTHPDVERLARALRDHPGGRAPLGDDTLVRRAAVALILRPAGDDLEVLMIRRAEFEGDPWSGHVALPGGRQEPGDRTLEQTAVRETWEETGVDLAREGQVLGCLDELRPRSPVLPPIVVTPFVAVVRPTVEVVESPEVAAAFWVPLALLRQPAMWVEATVVVRGEERRVPSFRHGEYLGWGLTERVLRQFLSYLE